MRTKAPKDTDTSPEATQNRVISTRALQKGRQQVAKNVATLEKLVTEYVPIDTIRANNYNPNRQSEHDFELLLRSMEEDGFTTPIVVNREGVIVDGEHRWRAAKTLGIPEIPVVRTDMTEEQAKIATIRHNRARGSHDVNLEAEVLRDLQRLGALDHAIDSLMLDDAEVNMLLTDIAAPEVLAGEEMSEAWVPASANQSEADAIVAGSTAVTEMQGQAGTQATALSQSAIDATRKREEALANAKTEQEKAAARADNATHRVNLVFGGEDGKIVKAFLGERPAEKVLELAKAAAAQG